MNKTVKIIGADGSVRTEQKMPKNSKKESSPDYLQYTGLGFYLVTPIIVGIGAGIMLDNWLHTKPLFVLSLLLFGFIASLYNLFKLTKQ